MCPVSLRARVCDSCGISFIAHRSDRSPSTSSMAVCRRHYYHVIAIFLIVVITFTIIDGDCNGESLCVCLLSMRRSVRSRNTSSMAVGGCDRAVLAVCPCPSSPSLRRSAVGRDDGRGAAAGEETTLLARTIFRCGWSCCWRG